MSSNEAQTGITVREIMSSPVVTVKETDSVETASILMKNRKIGSIVIVDDTNRPTGMLTERDIVIRVAALNLLPSDVQVSQVMSSPLIIVPPETDITIAAKKMSNSSIRRLVVTEKGLLVGIVSSKDLISITPELTEIIAHQVRLAPEPDEELPPVAGYCDHCNQWSEELNEVEGNYLCEECRVELSTEQ
ncbi:MAG: CBS domain-containing protein [Candidatus Bathyarchaeota archaeon]|nr:MAG: CBS domain-containing protein [Candidatus Bathyarchaeota archaeon]